MKKKQYILMLVFALLGGAIGGALSSRLLLLETLYTQEDEELRKVIVANEFHLVDSEGKERWALVLSKEGEPNLTFINKNGWAPMSIGVNRDGLPYLNMILEPFRNGGPSLTMMDSELRNRAVLGLRDNGEPYLTLLDNNGQMRATLGSIELKNPLTGSSERRPCSSLVLFGKDGKIIWSTPKTITLPIQVSKSLKNVKR